MLCRRSFLTLPAALALASQVPKRIVSTAPSATEMLFALGLGSRVVGVTTYCNYPPEAQKITRIGTYLQPNFEVILATRPDLVFVVRNPVRLKERLTALGLKVSELAEETVPGIAESIRIMGDAAAVPDAATALNARINAEFAAVRKLTSTRPPASMMFIVSRTPGRLEGLMVAGRESYLNELIRTAGGRNVFEDAPGSYPKVVLEEVFARNPDVLIDMGEMAETVGVTDTQKAAVVNLWRRNATLKAVKTNRVYAVASDIFVVPGPRVTEAARAFARLLHPELSL